MIATSGFLTALKYTKFILGRVSAPDPGERAHRAPSDLLTDLWSATSNGREREGIGLGRAGEGIGQERVGRGKGKEGNGREEK